MKKIGMNPVSLSVRYGRYGGYRYRFGIDMGDIGIGNPVSYRFFFNVISVSYICIKIGMNPVSVRYGGFWGYRFESSNRYRYIGVGIGRTLLYL